MDMYKIVKKYGKIYRKILAKGNFPDLDVKQETYEKKLAKMYASPKYAEYNIYPTTNAEYGDCCHDIIMDKRKIKN